MSELQDYDREGRKTFHNKADVWFARWIFEQPDDRPIYAQQFRHEMKGRLLPNGIPMPDINQSVHRFRRLGMLTQAMVDPPLTGGPVLYLPVEHEGWEPYAEFYANHIQQHTEEFAAMDASLSPEDL